MLCNSKKKSFICLISFLIIFSLLSFLWLVTFFSHIHILPNGQISVHSHVSNSQDGESSKTSHTHSNAEFLFHHILVHIKFSIIFIVLVSFVHVLFTVFSLYKIKISSLFTSDLQLLRAPPSPHF